MRKIKFLKEDLATAVSYKIYKYKKIIGVLVLFRASLKMDALWLLLVHIQQNLVYYWNLLSSPLF